MHPASLVVSSGEGLWDLLTTCTDRRLKLYMLKPALIQRKPESEYIHGHNSFGIGSVEL